jgi:hypothetical protein
MMLKTEGAYLMQKAAVLTLAFSLCCGCTGEKKTTAPEKASASAPAKAPVENPKAEAPQAEAKAEATKAAEQPKTATAIAKDALKNADETDAATALATLREYIDKTPTASDISEAAKLLTSEAVERSSQLIAQGKVKEGRELIGLILADSGELAPGVSKGLVMGREATAKLATLIRSAGLDDLAALREAAKVEGPLGAAAGRVLKYIEAPVRAFFTTPFKTDEQRENALTAVFSEGGALCKDARATTDVSKCKPDYYGLLKDTDLRSLPSTLLPVLRMAKLAREMGEKTHGLEQLPLAKGTATDLPAQTSETSVRLPGAVVTLDSAGVRVSARAFIDLATGALTGNTVASAVVMTSEAIRKASVPEDFTALATALQTAKLNGIKVEQALYGEDSPNKAGTENSSIVFDVAADVPISETRKVLGILSKAGFTDVRYRRGAATQDVLAIPTSVAVIPEARQGRKEQTPLLVNLTKTGADVFEAKGGEGKAATEANAVALPAKAKRWYKGTRVFKITVQSTGTDALVETVRSIRQSKGSGTVVIIAAADDVPTSRVLSAASALSEARGPADQLKLSEVFPGQACADEGGDASRKGCRSLFPTIPPAINVPKARGLTDEPVKKVVEKKPKPKPEPKPEAPKLGFCNKAGIKRVIRARTGSFKFCYERRLQLNNTLAGRVVGRLTIGGSGQVLSVSTSGSMPDKKVHECVKKQFKKLKFDKPENGGKCVVSYPFTFKP